MITAEQKNINILSRFDSKDLGCKSRVYVGLIDGKRVNMISPNSETEEQAINSFCRKFGKERFGGIVKE
jgi:hypothetical protein